MVFIDVALPPGTAARVYARSAPDRNPLSPARSVIPDPSERPVISAEEAFAELGIDRSTGYKAIREGTFPVPVIRVGRIIRVPTAALRQLLQLDNSSAPSSPEGTD